MPSGTEAIILGQDLRSTALKSVSVSNWSSVPRMNEVPRRDLSLDMTLFSNLKTL